MEGKIFIAAFEVVIPYVVGCQHLGGNCRLHRISRRRREYITPKRW
jgi:hypothetical protein